MKKEIIITCSRCGKEWLSGVPEPDDWICEECEGELRDYPIGGMAERYDIEKEEKMTNSYKKGFKDGRVYQLERDMENFDGLNPNPCDEK